MFEWDNPNSMDAIYAPRGPYSDDNFLQTPKVSVPPAGGGSDMQSKLEILLKFLVKQMPEFTPLGEFEARRAELQELNKEVRYCLWAMNVSIGVYMKLLHLVDIEVRHLISDAIGYFLADWKGEKGAALSDAMDVLIISEFTKYSIPNIPDMALLERNEHCDSIQSTVENYIEGIALKLDNMRHMHIDTVIEVLFPSSDKFIGRCFFPRLAVVSCKLLEIIKDSSCP